MSGYWAFYDARGEIILTGYMPDEDAKATARANRLSVIAGRVGLDRAKVYVAEGELVARPENPARQDGFWLRDMPVPTTILTGDMELVCTDPEAEFIFPVPGTYEVALQAWPHQDKSFTFVKDFDADPNPG